MSKIKFGHPIYDSRSDVQVYVREGEVRISITTPKAKVNCGSPDFAFSFCDRAIKRGDLPKDAWEIIMGEYELLVNSSKEELFIIEELTEKEQSHVESM